MHVTLGNPAFINLFLDFWLGNSQFSKEIVLDNFADFLNTVVALGYPYRWRRFVTLLLRTTVQKRHHMDFMRWSESTVGSTDFVQYGNILLKLE